MEITKSEILDKTNYGLNIYALILRRYFPAESVIKVSKNTCEPTRNPFNNNESTLLIAKKKSAFDFIDSSIENMKGDPFDFAKLHFKQEGQELLQTLNQELKLHLHEENHESSKDPSPQFSYFKKPILNINPSHSSNLLEIYHLIRSKKFKEATNHFRSIEDKKLARKYKASYFDYVTFSGTFTKRSNKNLIKHSGLITIDFDDIEDIQDLKEKLLSDKYFTTELLFTSPSGNGVKWIIPIELSEVSHSEYFQAISNYLNQTYKVDVDQSGKDIARACFLCHDKDVFINPKYFLI